MRRYVTRLLIFATCTCGSLTQEKTQIFLGGILDDRPENEEASGVTNREAFQYAVDISNIKLNRYDFNVLHDESFNHRTGPFRATSTVCSLIEQQALVVFGPRDPDDIFAVQSICDYKDIAHVVTTWVPNPEEHRSIINFYPHSDELVDAYINILRAHGWSRFILFYDDNSSLLRVGNLINLAKNDGFIVNVMQLTNSRDEEEGTYRKVLKEALHSGQKHFVIECKIEILENVLSQAQQVGMMTTGYNYFITNLDLQTIDLEPFRFSEANITGIRIFDPSGEFAASQTLGLSRTYPRFDINKMKTETALIIDAVTVLTNIITTKISLTETEMKNLSCNSEETAKYGSTIANQVKTTKYKELTGLIEFDRNGFRSNFNLDVIEVRETEISKSGTWNATSGLVVGQSQLVESGDILDSLRNKSFKIVTTLTDPYCMLKETSVQLFGNDRFEGFGVDLIHTLSEMEGFNYTFYIREDKKNGNQLPDGTWDGMIGDIIRETYDLAITDLTITADREKAVDFTSPFMNLGISILAKKPTNAPPSFFSFADPFALDTWIMLAIAYAVVAVSFFILGRLNKEEWTNPYPCIEEPEFLINQYTLSNSFWYAVGGLLQQGSEIAAKGISTRMLSGMWWLFILVMVSSYTANLAAFLATENPQNLFTDVNSLIENKEKYNIRMGAKDGGATEGFFKGKQNDPYKSIADYMEKHREDMVQDNKDGVALAENAIYAFFMESTSIEYEIQRHCDLQQYGNLLDDKGYGIAMRKNSTYRTRLSTAILKLQTSGEIDKIKRRWWEEKRGGGQCLANSDDDSTPPLSVKNVEGVVYITVGGTIAAIFLAVAEFLVKALKTSRKRKVPFGEVVKIEVKAYLDFNSNVKTPIRSKSESRSKSSQGTGTPNNNLIPPPASYGFIPAITKDELND